MVLMLAVLWGSEPAAATDTPSETLDTIPVTAEEATVTFDEYRALFDDLERSAIPRTEETVDGVREVTFQIDGFEMTLADVSKAEFSPHLGGGIDAGGPYVTFNQVDQTALLTGGAAALTAAICLIPAVGQVACAVAGVIVAVATVYANEYGRCPNEGDLKIYVITRFASCV